MDDLFKKFINTGVGFLSQGNKAMQTAIEKLVKESKLSEQEGKKIVDDLLKNSESKRADLEKQFKGLTEDLKSRVGLNADGKKAAAASKPKAAAAKPAAKAAPAKPAAAKKPATSTTAKVAGTVKKAADKVSDAASKTQHSAAAKAGATKKAAAKTAGEDNAQDAD
ncbi:hypothetical protein QMK33_10305 [Hymenobacter sp. H14-R3]|uniref:phasin family protein n=1 Tax=Hymenobacter sp. H14-R3 TaxID=3046308 RepID=UPI0024BA2179|nr:hypothetical protein [Hymenobacter sp. H14-R3]MDJ0365547.1 hypothetical protein [Hymenobacter sp. H14-R3]